ncbi:MAG: ChbG/HpnK family deacetylase [Silvibacterium sp.]|nr:ChbG/HpnK family deacetylase [Silvibacterium sp.]MBV8438305.1 ChbG/HpnK family deacetylase [Silvibacterium sp.]
MTYLIINADDFGLTPGVNQSIIELEQAGALTSATLMATAGDFKAAVSSSNRRPQLGVGCHVILVDGTPALPAGELPGLAANGEFQPTLGSFLGELVRGRIPEAEIEAEATAQIRRLQSAGVHVTHIDTHKHTHVFVRVLRPLLRATRACGVRAIRNPFEPAWAAAATPDAPNARRWQIRLLGARRRAFLRLVGDAGLNTTDGAIGVLATGILNTRTLQRLLSLMPQGTWELVCHPGYVDPALNGVRTRLRESRAIEHEALIDVISPYVQAHSEIKLTHFGQLSGLQL